MNFIKNGGKFEIIKCPENPIQDIAFAARECTNSHDKSSPEHDLKLVRSILEKEHFAMFEFCDLTVKFTNVSRTKTHQTVRHRLCSYAQKSQRYTTESNLNCVIPLNKDENMQIELENENQKWKGSLADWLKMNESLYNCLKKQGWKSEDARFFIPASTSSSILMKANLREWRSIFELRCDFHAQWEIRNVMLDLLKWCKENIPVVFDDFKFLETENGIKYAKRILYPAKVIKSINHYDDVELKELLNQLDNQTSIKIFQLLKDKCWR
jgi:thymidylate synthase (FAD)